MTTPRKGAGVRREGGCPFLAVEDRPPLVGVQVVPPRRTRLRGLHPDTSHAAGAKTGSYEEGTQLRTGNRIESFTQPAL